MKPKDYTVADLGLTHFIVTQPVEITPDMLTVMIPTEFLVADLGTYSEDYPVWRPSHQIADYLRTNRIDATYRKYKCSITTGYELAAGPDPMKITQSFAWIPFLVFRARADAIKFKLTFA